MNKLLMCSNILVHAHVWVRKFVCGRKFAQNQMCEIVTDFAHLHTRICVVCDVSMDGAKIPHTKC